MGDLVFTLWSILQHVVYLPYVTGRPIRTILEGCSNILAEFEESKCELATVIRYLAPLHPFCVVTYSFSFKTSSRRPYTKPQELLPDARESERPVV